MPENTKQRPLRDHLRSQVVVGTACVVYLRVVPCEGRAGDNRGSEWSARVCVLVYTLLPNHRFRSLEARDSVAKAWIGVCVSRTKLKGRPIIEWSYGGSMITALGPRLKMQAI